MGTQDLDIKVARLEAEHAVRTCMNAYMSMCDSLNSSTDLDKLAHLFTVYAVWEGMGSYAKVLGRHNGRQAIRDMFSKYTAPPPHFSMNVHILGNEKIDVSENGRDAVGRWVLLQPSTFSSGDSQLSCAKITARFVLDFDGVWRMNSFQTDRQFSRSMDKAWDADPLPVPENTGGNQANTSPPKPQPKKPNKLGAIPSKPVSTGKKPVASQKIPPSMGGKAEFTKGMITEKKIDDLGADIHTIVLAQRARLTPLARDRLRKRNIKIERVKS